MGLEFGTTFLDLRMCMCSGTDRNGMNLVGLSIVYRSKLELAGPLFASGKDSAQSTMWHCGSRAGARRGNMAVA